MNVLRYNLGLPGPIELSVKLGFGAGNVPRRSLSKAAILCWQYWHARGGILLQFLV
jgi:hypothetical protein